MFEWIWLTSWDSNITFIFVVVNLTYGKQNWYNWVLYWIGFSDIRTIYKERESKYGLLLLLSSFWVLIIVKWFMVILLWCVQELMLGLVVSGFVHWFERKLLGFDDNISDERVDMFERLCKMFLAHEFLRLYSDLLLVNISSLSSYACTLAIYHLWNVCRRFKMS